jgi:hypothetical protein
MVGPPTFNQQHTSKACLNKPFKFPPWGTVDAESEIRPSGADTTSMALTKAKDLSLGLKMRESLSLETLKRYENQCEVIFHKEVT